MVVAVLEREAKQRQPYQRADTSTAVATDIIEVELVEAPAETVATEALEVAESAAAATDKTATTSQASERNEAGHGPS